MIDLTLIATAVGSFLTGIAQRREGRAVKEVEQKARDSAIDTVMEAIIATKAYQYDQTITNSTDRKREVELASAWQKAANVIRRYDSELFDSSRIKALGWGDPREWENVAINPAKLKLNELIKQCEWLRDPEQRRQH